MLSNNDRNEKLKNAKIYVGLGYRTADAIATKISMEKGFETFRTQFLDFLVKAQEHAFATFCHENPSAELHQPIADLLMVKGAQAHEVLPTSCTTAKRAPTHAERAIGKTIAAKWSLYLIRSIRIAVRAPAASHASASSASSSGSARRAEFDALRKYHEDSAFVHLIRGDLSSIDPVMFDEGGKMCSTFLLDMHAIVRAYLQKNALGNAALLALADVDAAHKTAREPHDPKPATPPTLPATSARLKTMLDVLKPLVTQHFGPACEYLGLCVSMSRGYQWNADAFGTRFEARRIVGYTFKDEAGQPVDMAQSMALRLGTLSGDYMKASAKRLAALASARSASRTGESIRSVEHEICEVFEACAAKWRGIPLLPNYAVVRMMLINEYVARRPINLVVRRIHRNSASTSSLSDARVLQFAPGEEGAFVFDPSPHDATRPCLTFDAFSRFTPQTPGWEVLEYDGLDALYSVDSARYFKFLGTCDIATLVLVDAAERRAFPEWSVYPENVPVVDCDDVQAGRDYQTALHLAQAPRLTWTLGDSRVASPSLNFLASSSDLTCLHAEQTHYHRIARDYELLDAHQLSVSRSGIFRRGDRPVCLAIEQVRNMSFAEAGRHCAALKATLAGKTFPQVWKAHA